MRCLDAIARERDGAAVRDRGARARQRLARRLGRRGARATRRSTEVIALDRAPRQGARTTPRCCSAPAGATACCSTRTPSCCRARRAALHDALERATPRAGAAGARLLRPDGARAAVSAWRFPTPATALARRAVPAPPLRPCRAAASATRAVDWAQSAALLVRREAAREIGWLDPAFFVYSDEVDFCRRLRDAGWRTLYVPRRARRPPRAALDRQRCPSGGSSSSRATATATCASTTRAAAARARALAHGLGLRACARSPRSCCPATTRGATGATSPRRCARTAARACARPRSSTTAARGSRW